MHKFRLYRKDDDIPYILLEFNSNHYSYDLADRIAEKLAKEQKLYKTYRYEHINQAT